MECRLNTAKGCLEVAAAVTAESDADVAVEESTEKTATPHRPSSRQPLPVELPCETVRIEPLDKVCLAGGGRAGGAGRNCHRAAGHHQQRLQGHRKVTDEPRLPEMKCHRAGAVAHEAHRPELRVYCCKEQWPDRI